MASKDYIKAVDRGRQLLLELDKPPAAASASPWTTFASLAKEGWIQEDIGIGARFDGSKDVCPLPVDTAPHDSQYASESRNITWRHRAAFYTQRYHPAGVIFATSLRSPEVASLMVRESLREPLPKLHHWSDVTFLQWAELTENVPSIRKGLQKVVHCGVTNLETLMIIREILGPDYARSLSFPGLVFERGGREEVFAALLGTPNAMGTGFLLAQHKETLGWLEVKSIQIYTDIGWYLVVNVGQKSV